MKDYSTWITVKRVRIMRRIPILLLTILLATCFSTAVMAANVTPELYSVAPDTASNDGPVTIVFTGKTYQ